MYDEIHTALTVLSIYSEYEILRKTRGSNNNEAEADDEKGIISRSFTELLHNERSPAQLVNNTSTAELEQSPRVQERSIPICRRRRGSCCFES